MPTSTTAIFPPPLPKAPTDFGTLKVPKIIGVRSDRFHPAFFTHLEDLFTHNYGTAEVIDMSKNANIAKYSYTHVFDWILEVDGEPPVQAEGRVRLRLRDNARLNAIWSPEPIPPRVTWLNRIQQVLIVKTKYAEKIFLVREGQFEPHGRLEQYFSAVALKKIQSVLQMLRPGEGFFADMHPDYRGLDIQDACSVFVLDPREGVVQLPDHVVLEVAMKVLVK